jgi:hypothetical protein
MEYTWIYRGLDSEVIFDWRTTRKRKHLQSWLGKNFIGILQSDDYTAYEGYARI